MANSTNFVFFDATQSRNNNSPKITIRRGGVLVLNAGAVKMLSNGNDAEVTHVRVGYDAKTSAIGIRLASDDDTGKFRLRNQKKGPSRTINAKRVFDHHSLSVEKATSYSVEDFGEGIFGVTLREPSASPSASSSTGSGKRKAHA